NFNFYDIWAKWQGEISGAFAQRARQKYRLPSQKCDLSPTLWEVRSPSLSEVRSPSLSEVRSPRVSEVRSPSLSE
ncbi:MAG: hypothetical protein P5700_27140, partial [Arthrospira platensis PCC 7345]|nr:hypothetical protein [Arthrospira platensis PCC 7345]